MSRSRCWPTATATRIWLGSRDCSLQRRHQKVIEEAPAPGIDEALIAEVGERCAAACRQIGYCGVGTFEFLYEDGAFYFIEMNTRLQVEHPVTEMTTGIDIVQQQIARRARRAAGARAGRRALPAATRSNAASTPRTRTPSRRRPGASPPGSCRAASACASTAHAGAGYRVPPYYDSMIAKLIVHGSTRDDALDRMRLALAEMRVEGISTNLPLHREILQRRRLRRRRRRHPPSRALAAAEERRTMIRAACIRQPAGHHGAAVRGARRADARRRSSASGRWRARPRLARGARSRAGHEQPDAHLHAGAAQRDRTGSARGAAARRLGRGGGRCRSKAAWSSSRWSTAARAARTWPTWWRTPGSAWRRSSICTARRSTRSMRSAAIPAIAISAAWIRASRRRGARCRC